MGSVVEKTGRERGEIKEETSSFHFARERVRCEKDRKKRRERWKERKGKVSEKKN